MKKPFTLLIFLFLAGIAFAYDHGGSRLSIYSVNNTPLFVEIDAHPYILKDHLLVLRDIMPGRHDIKVFVQERIPGRIPHLIRRLVYGNALYVKPGYHLDLTFNCFGKAFLDERMIPAGNDHRPLAEDAGWYEDNRPQGGSGHPDARKGDGDKDRQGYASDDHDNGRSGQPGDRGGAYDDERDYDTHQRGGQDRHDNDHSGYDHDRHDRRGPVRVAMSDASFVDFLGAVRRELFDDSKTTVARQVIDQHYFTTQQVKQLALQFSFDNSRLDIAKYAYRHTLDRQNYYQLYDVFSFSKSKEELADYIRNFRE